MIQYNIYIEIKFGQFGEEKIWDSFEQN